MLSSVAYSTHVGRCCKTGFSWQDKAGASPAALAANGGHVDCVAKILDSSAAAAERGLSALHLAVQVMYQLKIRGNKAIALPYI